jgi:hypothetical protein
MAIDQAEGLLTREEKRWWSIKIQSFKSKEHFLEYAGRYGRRPPIAQRRMTQASQRKMLQVPLFSSRTLCRVGLHSSGLLCTLQPEQ